MSASCRGALADATPALEDLLRASHAVRAGPPRGMGAFELTTSEGARTAGAFGYAGKLFALRIRALLEEGHAAKALDVCLDGLAVARDVSSGTGLAGRRLGVELSELLFPACVSALDASPVAAKQAAVVTLSHLLEGTPRFADILRDWTTARMLEGFGPFLGKGLAKLSPELRKLAAAGPPPRTLSAKEVFLLKDFWHRTQARMDTLVAGAELPAPQRFERLEHAEKGDVGRFSPRLRTDFPDLLRIARVDERAREELRLLIAAAQVDAFRAEQGRWPELRELPATAAPLRLHEDAGTLEVENPNAARGPLKLSLTADP